MLSHFQSAWAPRLASEPPLLTELYPNARPRAMLVLTEHNDNSKETRAGQASELSVDVLPELLVLVV